MCDMQEAVAVLRDKGFKATPQRMAVYDALRAALTHPHAEDLYKELQPKYPTMSLATVYKSLEALCAAGLAQVIRIGDEACRYDANTSCHAHVCCTCCGRVEDVSNADGRELAAEIEAQTHYELMGRQLYFYGICPICRKDKR